MEKADGREEKADRNGDRDILGRHLLIVPKKKARGGTCYHIGSARVHNINYLHA
jgi:hypothetical protein